MKKRRRLKKGLAMFLTVAMVAGLMPDMGTMEVSAEETVEDTVSFNDAMALGEAEGQKPEQEEEQILELIEEQIPEQEEEQILEQIEELPLEEAEELILEEEQVLEHAGEQAPEQTVDTAVTFGSSEHTHCLCGAAHQNIGDHTAGESLIWQPWGSWGSGSAFPVESGNYYLTENVKNDSWWEIENGITINLCLNGYQFTADNIRLAQVNSGGKLSITDCVGTGYITVGNVDNNYEHCVNVVSGGEFRLFGGVLENFNRIVENSGTFRMYGGSLYGNKGGISYGGGVYNKGTFWMYGGTISNCSLNSTSHFGGGGVYNEGTVYMSGGSITNCGLGRTSSSATVYAKGSGVYNAGTFNMSGGSITGNKAYAAKNVGINTYGCGFYNLGTLNLSGNANISGNVIGQTNGTPSNLLIGTEGSTNITGNLDSNATIGVTHVNGAGTVANVAQGVIAAASCFIPDNSAWRAAKDSSGNIILKDASLVGLSGYVKVGNAFVSGATISFSQSESIIGSCTTNSSGYYIIDIHPGTYQVSLKLPGFDQAQDKGTITLTSDIEQTHDFTMAAETLPGTTTVSYMDQNGSVQQHLCRLITEKDKELTADYCGGWYAAWNTLTVEDRITVKGDVHLILMDGCNFTASYGIGVENGKSLTIYGQTKGSGTLNATAAGSSNEGAAIGSDSSGLANITINGGTVNARGGKSGAGIGGGTYSKGGKIVINGGTVNATGGAAAPGIGGGLLGNMDSITINGGTVNAVAGADPALRKRKIYGIGCSDGKTVGSIIINGGTVTAIGDLNGYGYGFSRVPTMGSSVPWKVSAGANGDSLMGVEKTNVSDNTYTQNEAVKVEACVNHEADAYTAVTDNTHSGTCKWCGTRFTESHTSDTYAVDAGNVISVTCACKKKLASYMLTAPSAGTLIYDGTEKRATVKDTMSNSPVTDISITYTKDGAPSFKGSPIEAGTYTASITLGSATVSVNYTIEQATPDPGTVSVASLNDTLDVSAVVFKRTDEKVSGTFSLKNVPQLQYGTQKYTYVFTPHDAVNYKSVEGTVSITVKDTVAPTASVKIKTNALNSIFNSATFGYFFKDTQYIDVETFDSGTGVAGTWYYVSSQSLTEDVVKELGDSAWSSYNSSDMPSLNKGKHYVYVKVTDKAGNTTYAGTDGIVIYEDSTSAAASIEYTYKENKDKTVTVTLNGNTVADIKYNVKTLTKDTDYSVTENGTITIAKTYLDSLAASDTPYTLTVSYNPQGETYKENKDTSSGNDLNDAPEETVIFIKVSKVSLDVTGVTATSRAYDGTKDVAVTSVTLDGVKNGDIVSVDTRNLTGTLTSANTGNYTSVTLPALTLTGTDAGNYTLVQPTSAVTTVVTISKADAQITVNTVTYNKTFGDKAFALSGVTDTNTDIDVQYTVTAGTDVVSVSNGIVTILKAGTATITVSLPESTNYNEADSKTITVNVAKKSGYIVADINNTYLYAKDNTGNIALSQYLPADCGNVTYGTPQVSGALYTTDGTPAVSEGVLTYKVNSVDTDATGTIQVTVSSDNYADFTITVNITLKGWIPVEITGIQAADITDSEANVSLTANDEGDYGIGRYYLYCTTESTANVTAEKIKENGKASETATIALSNLAENTTYYLYAMAEDVFGNVGIVKTANFTTNVKAPVISPAGGSHIGSVSVSISAGDGATIYYTTDGTEPTTDSTEYTQAFTLTASATVKAVAVINGTASSITQAQFTISSGGGSSGGSSDNNGTTGSSEVTTDKDSGSNVTTTTSPTEVKMENGTASATVKEENITEAIKQAEENKSTEIVFKVSEADAGKADTIQLTISKDAVQQILSNTAAELVVDTPAGDVILSQDTLAEALLAAEGTDLTIEVAQVTNPTDAQQNAVGENGCIVEVTMKSQGKEITAFGGQSLRIRLEIPTALLNKEIAVIHIAEDGKTEKMPGKIVTEGTKLFYEFTTTHLSTFALIEDRVQEETPTVSYPKKGTILTRSKTKMMYKITKAGVTGGTVQFVGTKNKTATTITIPATVTFDGITYKVTSIAARALKDNKVITKVVIGKNVTVIGTGAFRGCTKLKSVTIGKGVVSINSNAFYNCTSLTTLTIPASVTEIRDYAFKGCSKLTTLKINSTGLTTKTLSGLSMKGISTKTVIKVPKSKVKAYKTLFVKKGLSKKVTVKG